MRFSFGALLLGLALKLHGASGACGDSGSRLFGPDGNALRAAVSCVVLGTQCNNPILLTAMGITLGPGVTTDAAGVGNFYGTSITDWCTGEVQNFDGVFFNMPVRST